MTFFVKSVSHVVVCKILEFNIIRKNSDLAHLVLKKSVVLNSSNEQVKT